MNKKFTLSIVFAAIALLLVPEIGYGQYGIRRRTARRTAVVVGSTTAHAASASSAAAQQQVAAANQQTAAAQQQAAAAQQQAAAANEAAAAAERETAAAKQQTAIAKGLLPIGTVVPALPEGCKAIVVNNVAYSQCGLNYYRPVFQGNDLVYVTTAIPGAPPPE